MITSDALKAILYSSDVRGFWNLAVDTHEKVFQRLIYGRRLKIYRLRKQSVLQETFQI